jgi:thiamine biosynthesis lipoprotein
MPLPNSWKFQAIGTSWNIQTRGELDLSTKQATEILIEVFNRNYSRFDTNSIVRSMSTAGSYTFEEKYFSHLYGFYVHLYEITNGSVTPLIGRVLENAGYDEMYRLRSFNVHQAIESLEGIVLWDGKNTLRVSESVLLDFGAAAKGLLVDRIAGLLKSNGILEYYIDASGDSAHHGSDSYTVGLEHPLDTSKVIGTVSLSNESLCASATNRRAWKNGHHIIDGRTGAPTNDIIASWVIADSTMLADGLATALFFEWKKLIATYPKMAFLRMHSNGTIEMNQAMKERATLFS